MLNSKRIISLLIGTMLAVIAVLIHIASQYEVQQRDVESSVAIFNHRKDLSIVVQENVKGIVVEVVDNTIYITPYYKNEVENIISKYKKARLLK